MGMCVEQLSLQSNSCPCLSLIIPKSVSSHMVKKVCFADIENRLVDPAGEGEGGTNGESSTETYISPDVKY